MVGHLEVVIYKVDYKVGEPGIFAFLTREEGAEKAETLLAEVVSKDLKRHQRLVLRQTLCEKSQSQIIYVIVSHVQMD